MGGRAEGLRVDGPEDKTAQRSNAPAPSTNDRRVRIDKVAHQEQHRVLVLARLVCGRGRVSGLIERMTARNESRTPCAYDLTAQGTAFLETKNQNPHLR